MRRPAGPRRRGPRALRGCIWLLPVLLLGCDARRGGGGGGDDDDDLGPPGVPTEDVLDFRLVFAEPEPSEGCPSDVLDPLDSPYGFALVQRLHLPGDGVLEAWRREEGGVEADFERAAGGTLQGDVNQGIAAWASEEPSDAWGHPLEACALEADVSMRFGDELVNGRERVAIDLGDSCAEWSCTVDWAFEGTLLE